MVTTISKPLQTQETHKSTTKFPLGNVLLSRLLHINRPNMANGELGTKLLLKSLDLLVLRDPILHHLVKLVLGFLFVLQHLNHSASDQQQRDVGQTSSPESKKDSRLSFFDEDG